MREPENPIMCIPVALTWSARKAQVDEASTISSRNGQKLDIEMRAFIESGEEPCLVCMQLAAMQKCPSISGFEENWMLPLF